ncbi:FxSxx-COOH cyclophane-containing RiPP peptide [Krasilnikovia sp. MM14-A1259]|uniref:FxSxx-COOH cyclophane-containing RiPP peptide n=1 Tax=Krasilnikovia sp. MM14-A1259 TaxID=3373539 RepID=UPI003819CF21
MDLEDVPCLISDLVDLAGASLRRVDDMPESALLAGLRRILGEAGDLTERYQAFDNFSEPHHGPRASDDPVR